MGDSYAEVIVHDEKDDAGKRFRMIMILVTPAVIIYGAMFQALILMLGLILLPVDYILFKNWYREYEYLLISDELDVTLIKNRSRRKKLASYPLAELQCMAPVNSHRLDGFHGNPNLTVKDYSSGNPEHQIYSMIFSSQGNITEVKVEPTDAMMQEVRTKHASIVYRE